MSRPFAAIVGLPSGVVLQGSALALAASAADADSTYFTYDWSVRRGGATAAVGSGPALGVALAEPGVYTVTLEIRDQGGSLLSSDQDTYQKSGLEGEDAAAHAEGAPGH